MSEALILAKLATIEAKIDQLLAGGGASRGAAPAGNNGQRSGGDVASDRDLDSERGDPTIYKDPPAKYWSGATSYAGFHLSEVPEPDYLDAQAKYLDACAYMAEKDADEKKRKSARFKRLDAARARGWAKRLRDGWKPAAASSTHSTRDGSFAGGDGAGRDEFTGDANSDDDIPF